MSCEACCFGSPKTCFKERKSIVKKNAGAEVLNRCAEDPAYGFMLHAKLKAESLRGEAKQWDRVSKYAKKLGKKKK